MQVEAMAARWHERTRCQVQCRWSVSSDGGSHHMSSRAPYGPGRLLSSHRVETRCSLGVTASSGCCWRTEMRCRTLRTCVLHMAVHALGSARQDAVFGSAFTHEFHQDGSKPMLGQGLPVIKSLPPACQATLNPATSGNLPASTASTQCQG